MKHASNTCIVVKKHELLTVRTLKYRTVARFFQKCPENVDETRAEPSALAAKASVLALAGEQGELLRLVLLGPLLLPLGPLALPLLRVRQPLGCVLLFQVLPYGHQRARHRGRRSGLQLLRVL